MATPQLVSLALGALAGLAAGELSRALAARSDRSRWPDRLSWTLAVVGGLALALHPSGRSDPWLALVGAGLVGALLVVLASDLRERAVYPAIVVSGLAFAIVVGPALGTPRIDALLGAAVSTALFGAVYGLARLRYGAGTFGSGDVLVGALLGSTTGLGQLSAALAVAGLVGGATALVVGLRAGSRRASFPYAPVLCLGAFVAALG